MHFETLPASKICHPAKWQIYACIKIRELFVPLFGNFIWIGLL
ncbi:hypothetical protein AmDm5_1488 [Acetobacter malorum]|nr:hypothetical protein AmDm5_1488 [Acetobacter malorum]